VATVKAGALIFAPIGAGTASGQPLPRCPDHSRIRRSTPLHVADREKYTGVRAYWGDRKAARRTGGVLVGTSENEKKLQPTYATAEEARQHAEAEFKRLDRGTPSSATASLGRADIYRADRDERLQTGN
jgi:phage protein D